MGMFDSFYFKDPSILPDNKEDYTQEFQCKDLDCSLDKYIVDEDGFLYKKDYEGSDLSHHSPITDQIVIYSYVFEHHPDGYILNNGKTKYQEYELTIKNGIITSSVKTNERGYNTEGIDEKDN